MGLMNTLVELGYQAKDLVNLSHDELVVLTNEEFIQNRWTEAARAAAIAKRRWKDATGVKRRWKEVLNQ